MSDQSNNTGLRVFINSKSVDALKSTTASGDTIYKVTFDTDDSVEIMIYKEKWRDIDESSRPGI